MKKEKSLPVGRLIIRGKHKKKSKIIYSNEEVKVCKLKNWFSKIFKKEELKMDANYRRTTRYVRGEEVLEMFTSKEESWGKLYNFIKEKYKGINEDLVYVVRTVENKKNEILYILKVDKISLMG